MDYDVEVCYQCNAYCATQDGEVCNVCNGLGYTYRDFSYLNLPEFLEGRVISGNDLDPQFVLVANKRLESVRGV